MGSRPPIFDSWYGANKDIWKVFQWVGPSLYHLYLFTSIFIYFYLLNRFKNVILKNNIHIKDSMHSIGTLKKKNNCPHSSVLPKSLSFLQFLYHLLSKHNLIQSIFIGSEQVKMRFQFHCINKE